MSLGRLHQRLLLPTVVLTALVGCKHPKPAPPRPVEPSPTTLTLVDNTVALASPNGTTLVFSRANEQNEAHLFVAGRDGAEPRQITSRHTVDVDPAWSPDGKRIIFVRAARYRPYSMGGMTWDDYDLWTINPDGTGESRLTNNNFYQAGHPRFSPDQKHVVFWAYRPGTGGKPGSADVVIGDIEQNQTVGALHWMPVTPGPGGGSYFSADNRDPCYSPDGTRIAFISNRVGRPSPYDYELWLTDPAFTTMAQLTHLRTRLRSPTFTPDGRFIEVAAEPEKGGKAPLWRVKPDGTELQRLRE